MDNKWIKEFEDELVIFRGHIDPDFNNHSLLALLEKNLNWNTNEENKFLRSTIEVRVSSSKGAILIERINNE